MKPRRWQGFKWIRVEKRLAIYLRDGFACCYCGRSVEQEGIRLALDHLKPRSKGGTNDAGNLVTACVNCNCARQDRPWREFAADAARYLGRPVEGITGHMERTKRRKVDVKAAKTLMKRRGGFAAALRKGETE